MDRFDHLANLLVLSVLLPPEALTFNASPVSIKTVAAAQKRFKPITPVDSLEAPRLARKALNKRNLVCLISNLILIWLFHFLVATFSSYFFISESQNSTCFVVVFTISSGHAV